MDPEPFAENRYERMQYRRSGRSGLMLPRISLGGWHNFSDEPRARELMRFAFDHGITHFDLANNYGPPPGAAEESAGRILKKDFAAHRDELVISSKAGHLMWPGPYGEWGSRKSMLASLDQSLRRLQLDYVDIFYSHRFDPHTPLEETMAALDHAVRQGKALYAGISKYDEAATCEAAAIMRSLGTPITIHQPKYSMLNRSLERGLLRHTERLGIGVIAFSSLEQGLLTNRYLGGIPADSRAALESPFLTAQRITPELLARIRGLNEIASQRGQTLARMALTWTLRDPRVTSVIVGASRPSQLADTIAALEDSPLSEEELRQIEDVLRD